MEMQTFKIHIDDVSYSEPVTNQPQTTTSQAPLPQANQTPTDTQGIYLTLKELILGLGIEYNTITKHPAIRNADLNKGEFKVGKGVAKLYELNYIAKAYGKDPGEVLAKAKGQVNQSQNINASNANQGLITSKDETIKVLQHMNSVLEEQLRQASQLLTTKEETMQIQANQLQIQANQLTQLMGEVQRITYLQYNKKSGNSDEIEADFTSKVGNQSTAEEKPQHEPKKKVKQDSWWSRLFGG